MSSVVSVNVPNWAYLAAGGVVAGLAAYVVVKGPRGVAKNLAEGVGTAAGAVIEGGVVGLGRVVGVPETSMSQCQRDIAAGDTLAASFSCPAKEFIQYVFK